MLWRLIGVGVEGEAGGSETMPADGDVKSRCSDESQDVLSCAQTVRHKTGNDRNYTNRRATNLQVAIYNCCVYGIYGIFYNHLS